MVCSAGSLNRRSCSSSVRYLSCSCFPRIRSGTSRGRRCLVTGPVYFTTEPRQQDGGSSYMTEADVDSQLTAPAVPLPRRSSSRCHNRICRCSGVSAAGTSAAGTPVCGMSVGRAIISDLPVEVFVGQPATHALNPEGLNPCNLGRKIAVRHDHLRGERLIDA